MSKSTSPLVVQEAPPQYITMERPQVHPPPVTFEDESTFDTLKNPYAWLSYFYGMTLHFAFSIFSFVWVVTTFSVSMGLLIIVPVGVPLLYLSCQSWRLLAGIDGIILSSCTESFRPLRCYYTPNESIFRHFKNAILNSQSWKAGLYLAFYKFIYGVALFSFTVGTNPIAWLINPIRINSNDNDYKNLFSDPAGTWVQCGLQFIIAFVLFPLTFKFIRLSFILNSKIYVGMFQ
ncbi:hypothetical protein HDV06_005232 [Boothiomyces sp. JEL0866]|nr:hypothetical protein HDV06_005232 [Boothiomyces sp. JEL0866]